MSLPKTLLSLFLLLTIPLVTADDAAVMSNFLKSLTPPPSGWSETTPFCQWKGIQCDSSSHVTSISLASHSLTGTLPSDLNSLSQLRTLSLQDNSLTGTLPSLSNLSFLQTVYLNRNNFSSVSPTAFASLTSLQTLSLGSNPALQPWSFPTDLTSSSNLIDLDLATVSLTGPLPDIFDKFPSLQHLRLSYNNLTGNLPSSFSAANNLETLWLNNQAAGLSGTLLVLSNMSALNQSWLNKNQFTGSIPDLSQCTALSDLQLRDNQLTGVVPASLTSLPSLKKVSLDNNELQGPVPVFGKGVNVTLDGINSFCLDTPGNCDPRVMVLLQIAEAFGYPIRLAESWKGNDPCDGWNYVVCAAGKIITVNFEKQGLQGTISPAFANLTDLRTLFLNGNNLIGSIPDSLITLPQLQTLDVSDNNLSGLVPKFPPKVKLVTAGNALLGKPLSPGGGPSGTTPSGSSTGGSGGESSKGNSSVSPGWIAGIVVIVLFFIAVVLFVSWKCFVNKLQGKFSRVKGHENGKGGFKLDAVHVSNGYGGVPVELQSQSSGDRSDLHALDGPTFSIQVLRQVTNNFSEENILGRGGFGVVYKGVLHDGTKIAVKRMESVAMGNKGQKEFEAEIALLSKVRHRHLVALLGYCINGNERLLVYEYMPQDGKYSVETRLAGTFGYLAPEYAATGRVTTKVDVYAFGVVLMELITGRKALDDTVPDERSHLVTWFRRVLINKENIPKAIDQILNPDEETMGSIYTVAELAGHCTAREPYQRPDMGHAVNVLVPLVEQWKPTSHDEEEEDGSGGDLHMSLPQALRRWQANEGTSSIFNDISISQTQSSISSKPAGFADSFDSMDCR
ncbi:hypothetical protein JHK85_021464 [Glycine max]|nr:hypothetical protein JHK85_021464 [Glycine max]